MGLCLQCNKWVPQTEGKRAKKFCNDTCRSNYRYAKNKKIKFVKPTPDSFDGSKFKANFTADEPLSFDRLRQQIQQPKKQVSPEALMRQYVEERRDCTCQEEFIAWGERLQNDERLSRRQKELVKNTR